MTIKAYWVASFSLLLLTACIPERVVPPPETYTLSPQWNDGKQINKVHLNNGAIIKLAPIYAPQDLTSKDILYSDAPFRRSHYAFSRWNDSPTKLLQTLIQVRLENSNLFQAVIPAVSASKSDLTLEATLLDLSHRIYEDGNSEGIIRINFYLIDNSNNTVLATRELVAKVPASKQNARAAVIALNKAAQKIADDLVNWLVAQVNRQKIPATLCSGIC